jgi:hypothetical protein
MSDPNHSLSQQLRQSLVERLDVLRGHFLLALERGEVIILTEAEANQIEGLKALVYASDDRLSRFSRFYQSLAETHPYFELSTIVQSFFGGTLPEEWRLDAKPFDLASPDQTSLRGFLTALAEEALVGH